MTGLKTSISKMTEAITAILSENQPSVYLFGSVVLDDFRLGWSDIDILCLTQTEISQMQADELVELRQKLLENEPENPYYRSFEGGMLPLNAFLNHAPGRVIYWGTSGQRITDNYHFDSFGMAELLEDGVLLFGKDVRDRMIYPTYEQLRLDVMRHYEVIRKYAQTTGRSVKSYGWLLDVARGLYTLRIGKVIAKTKAGEWALEQGLCPAPEALETAVAIRKAFA
ncbi:MAG TPA: nucleotidyltransferase domain-containing protein, partial [Clostridiales bacterium]|nr:nucleotidyltransferase domain-containing protein [Clostridiales bacterium]